ncbi:uncharacterized protein AMSG_03846 [Thecamonas trahens ATCC 50062]|uniref:Calmodulin n=1 Tax=Thecamonas trahens ATCC 50062 TaxID=461836 RepID=A0A0L0D7X9_THETB|nr:hypothetical protein AMSG_03846 [Thecamonas trahens ATCC 50062]KNC47413.1 hypothetical protein AMSG_03846 [Thecamonas trahens ATCC 50062]|eukprot:XP_013759749.1 hypothetical protein AMSG_03846 [Thecamonas trahens ATCC 50062]
MGLVSDKVRHLLKEKRRLRSRLRRLEESGATEAEVASVKAEYQDMTEVVRELKADEARKAFVLFDKDRSGALSLDEFAVLASRLDPDLERSAIEAEFHAMDLNTDGKVSLAEFSRWWVAFAPDNKMRQKLKTALLRKFLHSKVSSDKQKAAVSELRAAASHLRAQVRALGAESLSDKSASVLRSTFASIHQDVLAALDEPAPEMSDAEPELEVYYPYFGPGVYDNAHINVSINAARPEAILRKLLQPAHVDPHLLRVFLYTHKRYLPSTLLLKAVVQRFLAHTAAGVLDPHHGGATLPPTLVDPNGTLANRDGPILAGVTWSSLETGEAIRVQALLFLHAWLATAGTDLSEDNLATIVRGFFDSIQSSKSSGVSADAPSARLVGFLSTELDVLETSLASVMLPASYDIDRLAPFFAPPHTTDDNLGNSVAALSDLSAYEWARQLTLLDFEAYTQIKPHEFLKNQAQPALGPFVNSFARRAAWVASEVTTPSLAQDRARAVVTFVDMAHCCAVLDNYASLVCIVSTLLSPPVQATFDLVPAAARARLATLEELVAPLLRFETTADVMSSVAPPAVPYIVPYEARLFNIEATHKTWCDATESRMVNIRKFTALADVIDTALVFQSGEYAIRPLYACRSYLARYPVLSHSALRERAAAGLSRIQSDGRMLSAGTSGAAAGNASAIVFAADPAVENAVKPVFGVMATPDSPVSGSSVPKPIRPLRAQITSVLDVHPLELARQLALLTHKQFAKVRAVDWTTTVVRDGRSSLLDPLVTPSLATLTFPQLVAFPGATDDESLASPAMGHFLDQLLHIMSWTQSQILLSSPHLVQAGQLIASSEALDSGTIDVVLVERLHSLCYVIDVAHASLLLGNFAGLAAIVLALHTAPIQRLSLTWRGLPSFFKHKLAALEAVIAFSPKSRRYPRYRLALDATHSPYVPLPSAHLVALFDLYYNVHGDEDAFATHPSTAAELDLLKNAATTPYRLRKLDDVVVCITQPAAGILSQNQAMAAAIKLEPEGHSISSVAKLWASGRAFEHISQIRDTGYDLSGEVFGAAAGPSASSDCSLGNFTLTEPLH